jgi:glutathione S-transferase
MAEFAIHIGNKNYSSWSLRGWLPLREAGFAFDEIVIPLRQPETKGSILEVSPAGKVPVLQHRGTTIWDSLAIGEYLAELVPRLLPDDREARALVRSVVAEMHSGFVALRSQMPMNLRAHYPGRAIDVEVQADIDRIAQIWRALRQRVGAGEGALLFGRFTLADAAFAPVVSRFRTYGVALDPVCQAYADALWSHDSMQDWIAGAMAEKTVIAEYEV